MRKRRGSWSEGQGTGYKRQKPEYPDTARKLAGRDGCPFVWHNRPDKYLAINAPIIIII